jgi:hypothetical protein
MSSEIIQSVVYDNYNDFQHVNLIFSQNFISLFWGLFNDETDFQFTILRPFGTRESIRRDGVELTIFHIEVKLAKFGYKSHMIRVKKFKHPSMFSILTEPIIEMWKRFIKIFLEIWKIPEVLMHHQFFWINYLNNQVTKIGGPKMCNDKPHTNNQSFEFRQLRCVTENKELKTWLNVLCLQSKVKANIFYKILGASKNLI